MDIFLLLLKILDPIFIKNKLLLKKQIASIKLISVFLYQMNKKIIIFAFLIAIFTIACNDGDLEVETISFENNDVLSCKANDTTATFLFKVNQKQVLILKLPTNVLENKAKTITGAIPSSYKVVYRTYSDNVSSSYFCSDYPPAQPTVVSEVQATGGTVSITTQAIYDENTHQLLRYDHLIRISDLVLVNSKGNKLVDSNFIFGTYQTNRR